MKWNQNIVGWALRKHDLIWFVFVLSARWQSQLWPLDASIRFHILTQWEYRTRWRLCPWSLILFLFVICQQFISWIKQQQRSFYVQSGMVVNRNDNRTIFTGWILIKYSSCCRSLTVYTPLTPFRSDNHKSHFSVQAISMRCIWPAPTPHLVSIINPLSSSCYILKCIAV